MNNVYVCYNPATQELVRVFKSEINALIYCNQMGYYYLVVESEGF